MIESLTAAFNIASYAPSKGLASKASAPAEPWSTGCATPTPPNSICADVSVYTLMKLLGHESMQTSQRYVTGAGAETRTAAAQNPLYGLLNDEPSSLDT